MPWIDGNALYLNWYGSNHTVYMSKFIKLYTYDVCLLLYLPKKVDFKKWALAADRFVCELRFPSLSKQPRACFAPLENGDAMGVVGTQ